MMKQYYVVCRKGNVVRIKTCMAKGLAFASKGIANKFKCEVTYATVDVELAKKRAIGLRTYIERTMANNVNEDNVVNKEEAVQDNKLLSDLESLDIESLKELCRENGVNTGNTKKKATLINKLMLVVNE